VEQVFDTIGLNINYYETNRMSTLSRFPDILFSMRLENGFISLYSM